MRAAAADGYDVLLAIDKNIEHQQNISEYEIAVVVLDVKRSKVELLIELLPTFREIISRCEKGLLYLIEK
ncbi:MAG: hypothetical protein ACRD6X_02995 [Pyrinomonadaceae bacterium]